MSQGQNNKLLNLFRTLVLLSHPRGRTIKEIAAQLKGDEDQGITTRTVQRYIKELEKEYPIWCSEDDPSFSDPTAAQGGAPRYGLLTECFPMLPPLKLTLEDAARVTAFLAPLLRGQSHQGPLLRLAEALLPALPEGMRNVLHHNLSEAASLPPLPESEAHALRALAQGWALRRKVRAEYQTASGSTRHYLLHIYSIEQVGHHLYAEAYIEDSNHTRDKGKLRELRLDRFAKVALTDEAFEAVPTFEETNERFRDSWGVIADAPLADVVLRFSPAVAARIEEKKWHRSQTVLDRKDDGSLEVGFCVSGTQEISRWILTWGAEVEVLKPAELREEIQREIADMMQLYKNSHQHLIESPRDSKPQRSREVTPTPFLHRQRMAI